MRNDVDCQFLIIIVLDLIRFSLRVPVCEANENERKFRLALCTQNGILHANNSFSKWNFTRKTISISFVWFDGHCADSVYGEPLMKSDMKSHNNMKKKSQLRFTFCHNKHRALSTTSFRRTISGTKFSLRDKTFEKTPSYSPFFSTLVHTTQSIRSSTNTKVSKIRKSSNHMEFFEWSSFRFSLCEQSKNNFAIIEKPSVPLKLFDDGHDWLFYCRMEQWKKRQYWNRKTIDCRCDDAQSPVTVCVHTRANNTKCTQS